MRPHLHRCVYLVQTSKNFLSVLSALWFPGKLEPGPQGCKKNWPNVASPVPASELDHEESEIHQST